MTAVKIAVRNDARKCGDRKVLVPLLVIAGVIAASLLCGIPGVPTLVALLSYFA